MSNPLYKSMKNAMNPQIAAFMKEVQDFKKSFNGDPRQEVERMMASGQLSQQQFNEYAQMATQIVAMMGK